MEAWNVQTEAILRHLRNHYEQKGWPASRLIPDEVGDYKAYIRGMEDRLEHLQPENLVSRSEFELLLQTVREVRDAGRPTPRVT